jgi:hypothetical protein
MFIKLTTLFLFVALSALARANDAASTNQASGISNPLPEKFQSQTNQNPAIAQQRIEEIRADCIQNRRLICGKILKVLPEGLVVDSGYTNLIRYPLNRSWLVPGTAVAEPATNLIEGNEPDSVCVGLVFITETPKSRRLKPKQYDYVIIGGYPAGQYTYTSLGTIQRTVRRFSAVLPKAVELNLQAEAKAPVPAAEVK